MPETAAADVEARAAALVGQHRPELERLVDQALERELAQLVEQRLALVALNGNGLPQMKRCNGPCGRLLPANRFEKHRGRCRDCRRQDVVQARQRRILEAAREQPEPEPRPAAIDPAELHARIARFGTIAPAELVAWLTTERLAVEHDGKLIATRRGLALGGALDELERAGSGRR